MSMPDLAELCNLIILQLVINQHFKKENHVNHISSRINKRS